MRHQPADRIGMNFMETTIDIRKEHVQFMANENGIKCYAPSIPRDMDGIYIREQVLAEVMLITGFLGEGEHEKRKADVCVWAKFRGGFLGSYHIPGCDKTWRIYSARKICECGKKVEVKK